MKSSLLLCVFLVVCQLTYSQDFITKWAYDRTTSELKFSALTTDTVHYTWTASRSGNSGNGSFIQTTPDQIILIGVNTMYGDTITLNMISDNLSRFYFESGQDQERLIEISQWGDVPWSSMTKAFLECRRFTISAVDTPDLRNVTSMDSMFYDAWYFNDEIGHWDVSNVSDMSYMFASNYKFNQDIGDWDVSNANNMSGMFNGSRAFNQDISGWDVANVITMSSMFRNTDTLNQDIGSWDVSNVTDISGMFAGTRVFNQDIGGWDVSNVSNMSKMFSGAESFNQDIGGWSVSNVTDMSYMFAYNDIFDQDISKWDVSNVSDMSYMFAYNDIFNQDISGWDVSNVTDMYKMFIDNDVFNQDISQWNVSSVMDMGAMFFRAQTFNADIGGWDVSNVTSMGGMFLLASSFNQDIGNWEVSNVTNMSGMFYIAEKFNQDIGDWTLHPEVYMGVMLDSSGMDCDHYSATLVGWQKNNPSVMDVTLGAEVLEYGTSSTAARGSLINVQGWIIEGDVPSDMECDALVSADYTASDHRLTIYPNPASDQVTIKGDQFELKDIRVLNAVGQDVTAQIVIQQQSPTSTAIDLSTLNSGIYFIRTLIGSGVVFKE